LPPLWPIWSQNGPQNGSQKCSKKEPTNIHFFFFLIFDHLNFAQDKHLKNADLNPNLDQHFCTKL
jgi:hypothetical protein